MICVWCNGKTKSETGVCRSCSSDSQPAIRTLIVTELERRVPQHLRYDGDFDNLVRAMEEDR